MQALLPVSGAIRLAISPDGTTVYVSNRPPAPCPWRFGGAITAIDTATLAFRELFIGCHDQTIDVAVSPDGGTAGITMHGGNGQSALTLPAIPPTPEEQTEAVTVLVTELVTTGALTTSDASAITSVLDSVVAALDRENVRAAEAQLHVAIRLVDNLARRGRLGAADADEIRDALNEILAGL